MIELQDNGDWSAYIALFVAGGFPWITQVKNLDIHFTYNNQSYREVFNAFASLFAFSIFFFLKTEVTDRFAYYFDLWWVIVIIAFALVTCYITLFMKSSTPTLTGMIIRFVIYVSIFCTLVAGFGLLYFEKDYYMIAGTVSGVKDGKAKIEVYAEGNPVKAVYTDNEGSFYLTLGKGTEYEKVVVYHPSITEGSQEFIIYDPIFTTFEHLNIDTE